MTDACAAMPHPSIDELAVGGRIIGLVIEQDIQNLVMPVKTEKGMARTVICQVRYIPLP